MAKLFFRRSLDLDDGKINDGIAQRFVKTQGWDARRIGVTMKTKYFHVENGYLILKSEEVFVGTCIPSHGIQSPEVSESPELFALATGTTKKFFLKERDRRLCSPSHLRVR
ncbi:hypothetical protein BaRGS_00002301 [Batillaria attramentaria]|uniref:Uncharacterized protein n=1 Tax=Batillaria attramentaria TaxID=370345 RepID=A0ABD0M2Y8_9CAEN